MRKAVIDCMKSSHLKGLNEIVGKVLNGKLEISNVQDFSRLSRYKNDLRNFRQNHKNPKIQRRLLKKDQKGGFLPFLIPIIAGLVTTAASEGIGAGIKAAVKARKHKKKK